MFSANATHALNFAIKGILNPGDHVIISHMEHNAVYRTLSFLQNEKIISFDIANCNERGFLDIGHLKSLINSKTRMIICIHGSNVSGTIQNIAEIGEICHENNILFLVDAAQSAGFVPIDMVEDKIDLLAFTGHKKLYGPTGIGGLCVKDVIPIRTLIHGGTGSKSELAEHPVFYPDCLEAGTLNAVGLTGLAISLALHALVFIGAFTHLGAPTDKPDPPAREPKVTVLYIRPPEPEKPAPEPAPPPPKAEAPAVPPPPIPVPGVPAAAEPVTPRQPAAMAAPPAPTAER